MDSRLIYIFVLCNMNMEAADKGAFSVHLLRKEIISQWWALGYIGRRADFHKSALPVIHFLCMYCKKEISFTPQNQKVMSPLFTVWFLPPSHEAPVRQRGSPISFV